MNLTTDINVFLRQSLRVGSFSFNIKIEHSNRETIAAMLEAERIAHVPNEKHYFDVKEALHELTSHRAGHREWHIQPDWLPIYWIEDDVLVLTLTRTGSHSALSGK